MNNSKHFYVITDVKQKQEEFTLKKNGNFPEFRSQGILDLQER